VPLGGRRRRQRAVARVLAVRLDSRFALAKPAPRLNAHLSSLVSSRSFRMPVEALPRTTHGSLESRLSSFGFSGTIAHGAFGAWRPALLLDGTRDWDSLFRSRRLVGLDDASRLLLSRLV